MTETVPCCYVCQVRTYSDPNYRVRRAKERWGGCFCGQRHAAIGGIWLMDEDVGIDWNPETDEWGPTEVEYV